MEVNRKLDSEAIARYRQVTHLKAIFSNMELGFKVARLLHFLKSLPLPTSFSVLH